MATRPVESVCESFGAAAKKNVYQGTRDAGQMLKAALLDMHANAVVELSDTKMANVIDRMLYAPRDCKSCFFDEVRTTRMVPPTLARFIVVEAKVYALVGRLKVHGCVAMDGDYLFALCVDKDSRGQGLGRRLLEHVLTVHADRNIHLSVFQPTRRLGRKLVEFYTQYGFEADGAPIGHYLHMRRLTATAVHACRLNDVRRHAREAHPSDAPRSEAVGLPPDDAPMDMVVQYARYRRGVDVTSSDDVTSS